MTTDELRRELRNYWDACIPLEDALKRLRADTRPDAAELTADWDAWNRKYVEDWLARHRARAAG